MAKVYWRGGRNGDWANARNWYSAVPVDDDAVFIRGAAFTVTLSTEQRLGDLTVSGAGVALDIVAGGSLQMYAQYAFTLSNGAALHVTGANADFGATGRFSDATVTFANGSALGDGDLYLDHCTLEVAGTVTLANAITFGNQGVADAIVNRVLVATGGTLTFGGAVEFADNVLIGDAEHKGTVVLAGRAPLGSGTVVEIRGGKLALARGLGTYDAPFALYPALQLDAGTRLDLSGNAVDAFSIQGEGTIVSSGAAARLRLVSDQPYHVGAITGAIVLTVPAYTNDPNSFFSDRATLDSAITLSNGGGIVLTDASLTLSGSLTLARTAAISMNEGGSLILSSTFTIAGAISLTNADLILRAAGSISGDITAHDSGGFGGYVGHQSADAVTISGRMTNVFLDQSGTGSLSLAHANTLSNVLISAGTLVLAAARALEAADVFLYGGTLLAAIDDTLFNAIEFGGSTTIAAARGKTLDLAGTITAIDARHTLTIGTAAANGIVVFDLGSGQAAGTGGNLVLAAGTMRIGAAAQAQSGLSLFSTVSVAAGATIDLRGHSAMLIGLAGTGTVTSSLAAATVLTLAGADFAGAMAGRKLAVSIALDPNGHSSDLTTLSGRSTYGGGTTIDGGAALALADGGSIAGRIVDNGVLIIDKSAASTLASAISGTGRLVQFGEGTTRLTGANSYSGGTSIRDGALSITSATALGTGTIEIDGGTLITSVGGVLGNGSLVLVDGGLRFTAEATLAGNLYVGLDGHVSATHGTAVTIASSVTLIDPSSSLIFGGGLADGTITLAPASLATGENDAFVEVDAGKLVVGNGLAAQLLGNSFFWSVAKGATLDMNGFSLTANELQQDGTIVNTGAAKTLTISGGFSHGAIAGAIEVALTGDLTFGGAGSFTALHVGDFRATFAAAAAETVYVDGGNATLVLVAGGSLSGRIVGFGAGDAIEFDTIDFSRNTKLTYGQQTHRLTVTDGTHSASVTLDGSYAKNGFVLSNDGDGHAVLSYAPAFAHAAPAAFGDDAIAIGPAAPPPELLLVG